MSNIVQYEGWSLEEAETEAKQVSKFQATEILKLKPGKNKLRFLPKLPGHGSPFQIVWQHFVEGPERPVVFPCPWRMDQSRCPVCDFGNKISRSNNPADRDAARKLWPSMRVFANAVDRSAQEDGPKIVAMPKTVYEALINIRRDEDAGGDFTDPKEGFDIIIEREGTGLNTRYRVATARTNSELENMDWIGMQHDLTRYAELPTRDVMESAMALLNDTAPPIDVTPSAPPTKRLSRTAADDIYSDDIPY